MHQQMHGDGFGTRYIKASGGGLIFIVSAVAAITARLLPLPFLVLAATA